MYDLRKKHVLLIPKQILVISEQQKTKYGHKINVNNFMCILLSAYDVHCITKGSLPKRSNHSGLGQSVSIRGQPYVCLNTLNYLN